MRETKFWGIFVILLLNEIQHGFCEDNSEPVVVETPLGTVTGQTVISDVNQQSYHTFKGIPYAKPPVGDLRFQPPQPPSAWGQLDATKFGSSCPQIDIFLSKQFDYMGNEDCLFLNIFTPSIPEAGANSCPTSSCPNQKGNALKPVMVWIHGGGFALGSGDFTIPEELVVLEDLVVVTINYRLGVLGFLSFMNNMVSGNMGLRDQIMALKWVQTHIALFGGDPDRVTIFGESAGGVSVHDLVLSPLSTGLFVGAIPQSGNGLMIPTSFTRQEHIGLKLAEMAGCNKNAIIRKDYQEILKCLLEVDPRNLVILSASPYMLIPELDISDVKIPDGVEKEDISSAFWPIRDDFATEPVLPLDPITAMESGAFQQVPQMMGTVKNEGAVFGPAPVEDAAKYFYFGERNPADVTSEQQRMADIAIKYYIGDKDADSREYMQAKLDLITDGMFLSPDQTVARMSAKHQPFIFNYQLTHQSKMSMSKLYGLSNHSYIHPVHGDDIFYVFTDKHNFFGKASDVSEDDRTVKKLMIKYWANFARYGHPSYLQDDDLPVWRPYMNEKNYMELKPEPEMKQELEPERMLFWDILVWNKQVAKSKKEILKQQLGLV